MTTFKLPSQPFCRRSNMLARHVKPKKNLRCGLCKLQLTAPHCLQPLQQSASIHTASNLNSSAKVKALTRTTAKRGSMQALQGETPSSCCCVLCCAVLCCAVLCSAVLCCAVLCCALHTAHCDSKEHVLLLQRQRGKEPETFRQA